MRAVPVGMPPGEVRHAVFNAQLHQPVIGGMELDLVDALAITIEGLQARPILIGLPAQLHHFAADQHAIRGDRRLGPGTAVAGQRLAQGQIGRVGVVGRQRWRLVLE